jgi:anti-anti-sigma factor
MFVMELTSSEAPGGPSFRAEVDPAAGQIIPHGELDLCSCHLLRRAGALALSGTADPITISLEDVRFIDASGMGVLLELTHAAAQAGRRLSLANPPARVTRALRYARLEHLLELGDNAPQAPGISPDDG